MAFLNLYGLRRATDAAALARGRPAPAVRLTSSRVRTLYLDANGVG